jgi:hypothetical protein
VKLVLLDLTVQMGTDSLTEDTGYKELKVILMLLDLMNANGVDGLLEYKEIKVTLVLLDLMVQMDLTVQVTGIQGNKGETGLAGSDGANGI